VARDLARLQLQRVVARDPVRLQLPRVVARDPARLLVPRVVARDRLLPRVVGKDLDPMCLGLPK